MAYSNTISIPMAYKDWLKKPAKTGNKLTKTGSKKTRRDWRGQKPAKTGRGVSRLSKTGETVRPLKTATVRLVRDVRTP